MIGEMIAESLQISLRYAEKLVIDVRPGDFGKLARVDGRAIPSNHPAWVYGHLAIYAPRILEGLGEDASEFAISDQWIELFGAKSQCQDDPEGTIYPPMEQLVSTLLRSYRAAEQTLRRAPDEKFAAPNPNEAMRSRFATVGGMDAFYCGGHIMIHMGQVSAWRRMMGLGSAM